MTDFNHKDSAKPLNDLAILLDRKGDAEQSVSLFQRALSIYRNTLGPQSPEARSVEQLLSNVEKELKR
jgi:hypothetical protein